MSDTPNTDAAMLFALRYPTYACACGRRGVKLWVLPEPAGTSLLCCQCLEGIGGGFTGDPFVAGCFPAVSDSEGRWLCWTDVPVARKVQWYSLPTWIDPTRELECLKAQVLHLVQRALASETWAYELSAEAMQAQRKLTTIAKVLQP